MDMILIALILIGFLISYIIPCIAIIITLPYLKSTDSITNWKDIVLTIGISLIPIGNIIGMTALYTDEVSNVSKFYRRLYFRNQQNLQDMLLLTPVALLLLVFLFN